MVKKKIGGWIVIYETATKLERSHTTKPVTNENIETSRIPEFLKDKRKTFLPVRYKQSYILFWR